MSSNVYLCNVQVNMWVLVHTYVAVKGEGVERRKLIQKCWQPCFYGIYKEIRQWAWAFAGGAWRWGKLMGKIDACKINSTLEYKALIVATAYSFEGALAERDVKQDQRRKTRTKTRNTAEDGSTDKRIHLCCLHLCCIHVYCIHMYYIYFLQVSPAPFQYSSSKLGL